MNRPTPIDQAQLKRFLLGLLPDGEHADVERRVLDQVEPLGNVDDSDLLTVSLRRLCGPVVSNSPLVDGLVQRLADLAADTPIPCGLGTSPEPERLGKFRLLRKLGAGGMGVVYEAEDTMLGRRVALKTIRPETTLRPESRQRFLREARAAAKLDHPHVVPILEAGEDGGVLYLAMPLLAGESLDCRLTSGRPLPVGEVVQVGLETAQGLAAAHAAGLIHRDIKPANLLLCPSGVKIIDFGLAALGETEPGLTPPGDLLGTPGYMSPEQVDGKTVDARSDLFSLGCVLYQMATGCCPFNGATTTARLLAITTHDPTPPAAMQPDLPEGLTWLILRLLEKDPNHRPASASEVVTLLQSFDRLAPTGSVPSRLPPPPRRSRSSGWAVATVGLGLLLALLMGGLGLLAWLNSTRSSESSPAPIVYQGSVDVTIWKKEPDLRRGRLGDGILPIKDGDQFRIHAQVSPAAYVYLFWIDTEGKVSPVYPWQPDKWGTRPADEQPIGRLELPPKQTTGFTIRGDAEGMETLLMLARPTKLALSDAEVQQLFEGLQPQRPVQSYSAAVWFENGEVVENDPLRQRSHFEIRDINDPVLRMQELLRTRLAQHASFTSAVSFAHKGTATRRSQGGSP